MVPAGAVVLENSRGSAPGLWLEEGDSVVLLLPGPPRELQPMLEALVDGPLRDRAAGAPLVRRVLKIAGRIESQTDEVLQPLYREWAAGHAANQRDDSGGARADRAASVGAAASATWPERRSTRAVRQVCAVLGEDVVQHRAARSMEAVVGDLLVVSRLPDRARRVVHRRADHVAADRRAGQLAVRGSRGGGLCERGEDRSAWRSARV